MDELTSAFMKALPELPQDIAFTYKSEIRTILTLKDGSIFPGAQPVSLEPRRGLPDIVINEYLLCEKTDGTRFLLYIPIDFTEPNMALDLTAHTTESEGLALPRTYFLIDREYNFHKTEG
ncbi:MRNA capping enzyme alpha subunit (mRNA guanylyltransferase) [Giardia duodenalis]|nr:MRNA capping enzyme alpha subunit (mRNA guanylyltransferase) [Giardia intestinalis]